MHRPLTIHSDTIGRYFNYSSIQRVTFTHGKVHRGPQRLSLRAILSHLADLTDLKLNCNHPLKFDQTYILCLPDLTDWLIAKT